MRRRKNLLPILACLPILAGLPLAGEGLWIKAKAELAQVLLDRAFDASVATGRPVKPWSWADTWPVARIEVPRLGVSVLALHGGSGQSLAFGPGHLSSTPDPGTPGTAVYAAHRDTHFAFLGALKPGDLIRVTRIDGVRLAYRVTGSSVVSWDAPGIDAHAAGHHLALATCWPLDAMTQGPLRLVVRADLARDFARYTE